MEERTVRRRRRRSQAHRLPQNDALRRRLQVLSCGKSREGRTAKSGSASKRLVSHDKLCCRLQFLSDIIHTSAGVWIISGGRQLCKIKLPVRAAEFDIRRCFFYQVSGKENLKRTANRIVSAKPNRPVRPARRESFPPLE